MKTYKNSWAFKQLNETKKKVVKVLIAIFTKYVSNIIKKGKFNWQSGLFLITYFNLCLFIITQKYAVIFIFSYIFYIFFCTISQKNMVEEELGSVSANGVGSG